MGNANNTQETEIISPLGIELFILGLRNFRKRVLTLTVDGSYEVTNGLSGMMRNVLLRLLAIISNRSGITRKLRNRSLKAIMGTSQEQMALRKHPCYVEIRTIPLMPVNPAADLLRARDVLTKYQKIKEEIAYYEYVTLDASLIVEDILCIIEMVRRYHLVSDSNIDVAAANTNASGSVSADAMKSTPCLLLNCLLRVSSAFITYRYSNRNLVVKVQQAIALSPAFNLVRQFIGLTRSTYLRRMGCMILGFFYADRWVPQGYTLHPTIVTEVIDTISAYDTMFRSYTVFRNEAAVRASEVSHGLASLFGDDGEDHKSMHLLKTSVEVVTVMFRISAAAKATGPTMREKYQARFLAALVGLFGCANAAASLFAGERLWMYPKDVTGKGFDAMVIAQLINGGLVTALENRLGAFLSDADEPRDRVYQLLMECCGNDFGREAIIASNVIQLVCQLVQKSATSYLRIYNKTMLRILLSVARHSSASDTRLRLKEMYCSFGMQKVIQDELKIYRTRSSGFVDDLEALLNFLF